MKHLRFILDKVFKEKKRSGCSSRAAAAKNTASSHTAGSRRHIILHYFPSTPKEHFRHMHYSAIDVTIECIGTRFNGKDFKVYRKFF